MTKSMKVPDCYTSRNPKYKYTRKYSRNTKYGWIPSLPDPRDYTYTPPLMDTLPSSVDLRSSMPPVFNQGNIGSCTAQALSALLQYDEVKQNKTDKSTPSRLFIYYNERLLQNTVNADSGSSMRNGINSLITFGFSSESLWPYDPTKWKAKPPTNVYSAASPEKIHTYARISQSSNQLKAALAVGTLFVFGFVVYDNFELQSVAQTGIMQMPAGSVLGGHAVIAVGYDDASQTFLIRNSWGDGWGIGGYFKMPYSYISNPSLTADFWTIQTIP